MASCIGAKEFTKIIEIVSCTSCHFLLSKLSVFYLDFHYLCNNIFNIQSFILILNYMYINVEYRICHDYVIFQGHLSQISTLISISLRYNSFCVPEFGNKSCEIKLLNTGGFSRSAQLFYKNFNKF